MKISNHQLLPVLTTLSNISFPNTISVDSITGLISATSEISSLSENFKKVATALMESYGLKPDENGNYQFKGHENESEIAEKWVELLNKVNELNIEFKEENLYAKIGAGLHMQEVLLLKEVLK
jgi:hypothetical protein